MSKYIFIILIIRFTFQLSGQSPLVDIEGKSNYEESIEIQGSDSELFPDLIIKSDRALMHLGEGRSGPHGFIFGDEESGPEMKLFYRTGPHKLTFEYGTNIFLDFEELFSIDTLGNTQIAGSLNIGNVSVSGQTRMLTVDQDGNVGSQTIPSTSTSSDSFLEIPVLDEAGSLNSFTIDNFQDKDAFGFPVGPRSFRIRRVANGLTPVSIMDLNAGRTIFSHENSIGSSMNFRNESTSPNAGGIAIDIGTSSTILSESNEFLIFRAGNQEVGAVRGQIPLSVLINQVANSIFPVTASQSDINNTNHSQSDLDDTPERDSQISSSDQGSQSASINALLENPIVVEALFMTMDFIVGVISNIINLTSAIAGIAVFGDVDDAIWSGIELTNTIVQYASYIYFIDVNEGISYESGNGDYAEWLMRGYQNEKIVAGNIVGVNGGEISTKFSEAERFMVVSDQPFVLGNMPKENQGQFYEKVAFLGQVPVRVLGEVRKGDYILPSGNLDGYGIAVSLAEMKTRDYSRIVGVAWQDSEKDQIISTINTAVGINANDITHQVEKMQIMLNKMQMSLAKLDSDFEVNLYDVNGSIQEYNSDLTISPSLSDLTASSIANHTEIDLSEIDSISSKEQIMEITRAHFQSAKNVLEKQGISLDMFPYMEELFNDPSPETLAKVQKYYEGALDNVHDLLAQINGG